MWQKFLTFFIALLEATNMIPRGELDFDRDEAETPAISGALTKSKRRRGRRFRYLNNVARWYPLIRICMDEERVPVSKLDPRQVQAIIHVESCGKPNAHRDGSQFYGLTQVGKDVAHETRTSRKTMHGTSNAAAREGIIAYLRWAKMYQQFHKWDPELMALGWKGGVGTLDTFNDKVAEAGTRTKAIERWLDKKRWGTWKYVRKYRAAASIWFAPDPQKAPHKWVR